MGDLTLTAGAQYKEEVGGYGAGQFDVINVTGAVKLNNATLNATLYGGFAASVGSSALVIINNDGADAVVGTFAGLAEGATVNVGLDYLVHSSSNPSDLNDPYYSKFGTENRYINFAAALAKGGTGTAAYHAAYDALSLSDAVTKAYGSIFGVAPVAGKVAQILGEMVPDGLGGQETRAQYFAFYGGDGANGVGAKAAAIGFLLADAIKEGLGPYNAAQQHFLTDLGAGSAAFNVDLVGTYAPSASSGNTMVDAGALH